MPANKVVKYSPKYVHPNSLANLNTFKPGPDARRGAGGRPNPLNDPEFVKQVAEAFAAGLSRRQMLELFDYKDPDTITRWRRDPRVKAQAFKLIEDRVLQVTRKVDAVLANRLEQADAMTIKELLAIRKEFLGGALRARTESIDENTIGEMQEFVEKNPEGMALLEQMFSGTLPIPGALPSED